jgi:hypothetical protein
MRRASTSVFLYLALVFLSGIVVGAVGYGLYEARSVSAKSNPCSPDRLRRSYVDEMKLHFNLRPEQVTELETILDATHAKFQALRERNRPEVVAIQEEQAQKIRAILDEPQRAAYEKWHQERIKKRKMERSGR